MTSPAVCVATMTLARDEREQSLILRSLYQLSAHGWPVVATDGGSPARFVERLRAVPGVRVLQARGLVAQITSSLGAAIAGNAHYVFYAESDKHDFFAQPTCFDVLRDARDRHVAVVARSCASFATYPNRQQRAEAIINRRCGTAFGISGDYSYGPFLIPRGLAMRLVALPAHLGWGWRHWTFAIAHHLGYQLAMVEGHYPCPLDQRAESALDRAHRNRQLRQNLAGLALGLSTPLPQ